MPNLTVLVPLDGSKAAEQALLYLRALSPLSNLRIRLLGVVESDGSVSGAEETAREHLVADYLEGVDRRLQGEFDRPIECVRRTGKPFVEILEEAADPTVNFILMTTHGRTSGKDDRLGSVADKVVRGATCPTLLVGPHASVPLVMEQITVALDGSALAAEALPVARALAERLNSRLRLVRAVEHPLSLESDTVGSLATDLVESLDLTASLYLSEAKLEMETRQPVETAVLSGPPAEALMMDVKQNPPSILIMTSHGHTGFIKWALGSVTDRLIRGPVPVLVLRPEHEVGNRMKPLASEPNQTSSSQR
ncbi:MAG TPA: universal stress protein [Dehalococcoidia bacterium]|nr:universal stress protein [Dehalococcoidia bacterium]